jgi:hypothetical protein
MTLSKAERVFRAGLRIEMQECLLFRPEFIRYGLSSWHFLSSTESLVREIVTLGAFYRLASKV